MASQDGTLYHLAPLAAWSAAKAAGTPYTPSTYEQVCVAYEQLGRAQPRRSARSALPRPAAQLASRRTECAPRARAAPQRQRAGTLAGCAA